MAKRKATSDTPQLVTEAENKYSEWRVRDALETMQRAGEIIKDKKMLAKVKAMASEKASAMQELGQKAALLAKAGMISEKALAKIKSA